MGNTFFQTTMNLGMGSNPIKHTNGGTGTNTTITTITAPTSRITGKETTKCKPIAPPCTVQGTMVVGVGCARFCAHGQIHFCERCTCWHPWIWGSALGSPLGRPGCGKCECIRCCAYGQIHFCECFTFWHPWIWGSALGSPLGRPGCGKCECIRFCAHAQKRAKACWRALLCGYKHP